MKKKRLIGMANPVTEQEANRMFKYWLKVKDAGGYTAVAVNFDRSRDAVKRAAKRYEWLKRAGEIEKRVRKHIDNKLVETKRTNADFGIQLRDTVLAAFFKKTRKQLQSEVSATDCVKIMEYTDRIGAGGDPSTREGTAVPPEVLTKTLEMVKSLGVDGLKAIGKWIVETFKTPEELLNGNGQG